MPSQRVLVVGGAGYIGSHMVKDLLQSGCEVITLDNLSRGHRELVPGGEFVEGDLGDALTIDSIFSRWRIDAVMHFAALSLVGESVTDPLPYYRNNVANTVTLLDRMREHGIERFIFSSTAAVYGEPSQVPITEEHPCAPTNPYGESKLAVEHVLRDCSSAYGLRYVALRYFNAAGADADARLGERHNPETHLIPIVLQVATGERERVTIFGDDYPTIDGTCIRDYVHVSDLSLAHRLALQALTAGGASGTFNLGNSKGYSVRQVIDTARRVTRHAIPAETAERRAGDPAVLIADSDRIRRQLGWKPRYEGLESIIETAWRWHQKEHC